MIEGTEMNFRTCAFTGHRPQGMPFGFDEHDPKCAYLIDQINGDNDEHDHQR